MSQTRYLALAATLMAFAVVMGAFGAHALRSRIDAHYMAIWEKAVLYHLVHALGILVLASSSQVFLLAGQATLICLSAGLVIFSGSLYLLVLTQISWLGAITPLGGSAMILGWLLLAWRMLRSGA